MSYVCSDFRRLVAGFGFAFTWRRRRSRPHPARGGQARRPDRDRRFTGGAEVPGQDQGGRPDAKASRPGADAGPCCAQGGRFRRDRQGHRRGRAGPGTGGQRPSLPVLRRIRAGFFRPRPPHRQARAGFRPRAAVQSVLVPRRRTQISPHPRRGPARLLRHPAFRPGDAADLPDGDRQGSHASRIFDARGHGLGPWPDRDLRRAAVGAAHLSLRPYQQSHRRRAGRADIPASGAPAAGLFRGPARRRQRRPRARAGNDPPVHHQLHHDPGPRPRLLRGLPVGDVHLFLHARLDRRRGAAVLRAARRWRPRPPSAAAWTRNSAAAPRTRLFSSRA